MAMPLAIHEQKAVPAPRAFFLCRVLCFFPRVYCFPWIFLCLVIFSSAWAQYISCEMQWAHPLLQFQVWARVVWHQNPVGGCLEAAVRHGMHQTKGNGRPRHERHQQTEYWADFIPKYQKKNAPLFKNTLFGKQNTTFSPSQARWVWWILDLSFRVSGSKAGRGGSNPHVFRF